jgi:hypothetical protein
MAERWSAAVWFWSPDDDGHELPGGLEAVEFQWTDTCAVPYTAPGDRTKAAHDFLTQLEARAAEWYRDRAEREGLEGVPGHDKDRFAMVHAQCCAGGPIIQIHISVDWSPTFRGSVEIGERGHNEEDPRRAYFAMLPFFVGPTYP